MSLSLPPLSALRAFEAAGRLLSFSNAAIELSVTQSAISRHVRRLEDHLGARLFERLTRRVELTEQGRGYLAEVQAALSHLEQASARIRSPEMRSILTISVLPSFGSFWLMPKLASFTQRHPEIDTRVISSIRPIDLHSGEADVAIRVGQLPGRRYDPLMPRVDLEMTTNWRGIVADKLTDDVLVPICSPSFLRDRPPLRHPRDLLKLPLVHMASRPSAWPDWFRAQGVPPTPLPRRDIEYGHFFMAMDAAREGAGVAIVPDVLLSGPHMKGLVTPFEATMPSAGCYCLLWLNTRADERKISLFRRWISEQFASETSAFALRPARSHRHRSKPVEASITAVQQEQPSRHASGRGSILS